VGYENGKKIADEQMHLVLEYWDDVHQCDLDEEDVSFLEVLVHMVISNVFVQSRNLSLSTLCAYRELKPSSEDWYECNKRVSLLALESALGRAWIWDSVCHFFNDWKWKEMDVHDWLARLDKFFKSLNAADLPVSSGSLDCLEESLPNLEQGHSFCSRNEEAMGRGGVGGDGMDSKHGSDEDVMLNDLICKVGLENLLSMQMGAMIEGVCGVCLDGSIGKRPLSDNVNEIDDSLKKIL